MPPPPPPNCCSGLRTGLDGRNASMIDGGEFDGAKAYKDSKVGKGTKTSSLCVTATLLG